MRGQEDTPEQIKACLECKFPDCINCLDANTEYGWAVRFWWAEHDKRDPEALEKFIQRTIGRRL